MQIHLKPGLRLAFTPLSSRFYASASGASLAAKWAAPACCSAGCGRLAFSSWWGCLDWQATAVRLSTPSHSSAGDQRGQTCLGSTSWWTEASQSSEPRWAALRAIFSQQAQALRSLLSSGLPFSLAWQLWWVWCSTAGSWSAPNSARFAALLGHSQLY